MLRTAPSMSEFRASITKEALARRCTTPSPFFGSSAAAAGGTSPLKGEDIADGTPPYLWLVMVKI